MWILAMFDLPTATKEHKRAYRTFRNVLLNDGFMALQYSVYARPCPSLENAEVHYKRIKEAIPPSGEVRIILFTDKQFGNMKVFFGGRKTYPEPAPQMVLML